MAGVLIQSDSSPLLLEQQQQLQFAFANNKRCKVLIRTSKSARAAQQASSVSSRSSTSHQQSSRRPCFASLALSGNNASGAATAATAAAGSPGEIHTASFCCFQGVGCVHSCALWRPVIGDPASVALSSHTHWRVRFTQPLLALTLDRCPHNKTSAGC